MAGQTPPKGLAEGGSALWREVTDVRTALRADHRRVLLDACREADLIDALEDEMQGSPRTVKGSMGQTVIHPLISELRQHRTTLNTLLRALDMPDTDSGAQDAAKATRGAAMALARARWDRKTS